MADARPRSLLRRARPARQGPAQRHRHRQRPATLLVLGQREFAGVLDEVPTLAHKLLADDGRPPPRGRGGPHRRLAGLVALSHHGTPRDMALPVRGKASQVALLLGVGFAVVTAVSGDHRHGHAVARRQQRSEREVFVNIPSALQGGLLRHAHRRLRRRRLAVRQALRGLRAGHARPAAPPRAKNVKRRARRLPGRRLHADAVARRRRRADAQPHLLPVPRPVRRHLDPRAQPPAARVGQVPARRRVRRATPPSATCCGVLFLVGIGWAIAAPLRPQGLPDPHQDPPRGRPHPRHAPRASASPASWPKAPASPWRAARPSRSGASSATRSRALFENAEHVARRAPGPVGRPRRRLHRLPGDPPDHQDAPHVHLPDEHVPEGPRAPQGRHEADPQHDGDVARDLRGRTSSRSSPGSSCSTPTPAPSAAGARAVCPAHATGKPLDPREIVLKVGHVMAVTNPGGPVSPVGRPGPRDHRRAPPACSSASPPRRCGPAPRCKACDENCPVNIEILDKILDMRRYLALMESELPDRARQDVQRHGEPGEPLVALAVVTGPTGPTACPSRSRSSTAPRRSATSTSSGSAAPAASTTGPARSPSPPPSCSSGPASTSPSSARPRSAPATRPAARATSTSSRCWRCRTSRRSTAWA